MCVPTAGVILVGSSFVSHLRSFLQKRREVMQVPLPVKFISKGGLRLKDFRALVDEKLGRADPAYIILHLGANDIVPLSAYSWRWEIEAVVTYLRVRYPNTKILWSDMLPRANWRGLC